MVNTRLKLLRESLKISKQELAKKCNTNRVSLAKWENGDNYPPTLIAIFLANYYTASLDYIFLRTDKKIPIHEYEAKLRLELLDKDTCANLNIYPMHLKTWSNGVLPKISTCTKIADYHDISLDYLLGLSPFRNWDLYDEENECYPRLAGIPVKISSTEDTIKSDSYGLVSDDASKIYLPDGTNIPIKTVKFTEIL